MPGRVDKAQARQDEHRVAEPGQERVRNMICQSRTRIREDQAMTRPHVYRLVPEVPREPLVLEQDAGTSSQKACARRQNASQHTRVQDAAQQPALQAYDVRGDGRQENQPGAVLRRSSKPGEEP